MLTRSLDMGLASPSTTLTGTPATGRHAFAGLRPNQRAARQECCSSSGAADGARERYHWQTRRETSNLDDEWKNMRPLFKSLDAELDESWAQPSSASTRFSADDTRNRLEDNWEFSDDSYTPFPSNLPAGQASLSPPPSAGTSDNVWSLSQRANYNMMSTTPMWGELSQVFVILFGVGETETEGIYSLRGITRKDTLPQETIIAFEDAEDAERYAGLLEATMEHAPNVCPIEPMELLEFCMDSGYSYRLEPRGSLLIPPEFNVGMTDWERSMRLRMGQYSVLEADPSAFEGAFQGQLASFVGDMPLLGNNASLYPMSESSLNELKARLERLLPED